MKSLSECRILVVGDIMLDKYVVGEVTRISPEAPVPVVHVKDTYYTLGGCGNVVNNIASLGAHVTCISQANTNDNNGEKVKILLKEAGDVHFSLHHTVTPTIVKERIISRNPHVQMLRVDTETFYEFDPKCFPLNDLKREDFDIIIISDYAKGMITNELISQLHELDADIILDPKPSNWDCYKIKSNFNKIEIITPNKKEYDELINLSGDLQYFDLNFNHVIKTLGKDGMVHMNKGFVYNHISSEPIDVYNVSGAGDTVVATLALCISMGFDILSAAQVANECARYVVSQPGTSVVPLKIFNDSFDRVKKELNSGD